MPKPRTRVPKVNLFQYSSHRRYIADCLESLRTENPKLSYQKLLEELQLTSKSQVFRLLKGEAFVLSKELVYRLSAYLGHSARESEFFHLLVAFGESESESDRLFFFEQLQKVARPIAKSRFSSNEYDYFSEWYLPVVRELVTHPSFQGDLGKVGKCINPPLSAKQVGDALALLERLGMVRAEGSGYVQSQAAIVPDPEFRSLVIRSYQLRHFRVVEDALKGSEQQDQHLGAITFGINDEGLQRIRAKFSEFIGEAIAIAAQYENSYDRVMQLNMQLYPMSKKLNSDP